jgi:hypothetical protein
MDHTGRLQTLHTMLDLAISLAHEEDPVLDEAAPRLVAILHDTLRLVDVEYFGDVIEHE